ncbi:MAG: hypothetical protein V8Q43_02410 [Christensenellaceae bacterium]
MDTTVFFEMHRDLSQDRYGNVYGHIGEKVGPTLLVMAHMDEVGMIVTDIEETACCACARLRASTRACCPVPRCACSAAKPSPPWCDPAAFAERGRQG